MGRIWLICCADALYRRARHEIDQRDAGARIVRLDSVGSVQELARACGAEDVSLMLECDGGEADGAGAPSEIATFIVASPCEAIVLARGCSPADMACLLRAGAREIIAVGDDEVASFPPVRPTVLETCGENDYCMDAADGRVPTRDDLVPLEELWPPLDEALLLETPPWSVSSPEETGTLLERGFASADSTAAEVWDVRGVDEEFHGSDDASSGVNPLEAGRPHTSSVPAPDMREIATRAAARASTVGSGHRAPLVTVVSGRGGVGKTTVVAALAACAARAGLRAAVLDLDLMFGNMPVVLGAENFKGLEGLATHEREEVIAECDIEETAMRVGPCLTLWGPLAQGERAELFGGEVEQLIAALRGAADVIFADTSCTWGDVAAVAIGACDRCLVVGSGGEASGTSASRAVEIATRLGVPATRMTSVFNRMGARGCGEEAAMRFEMGASLHSRARIVDGGDGVSGMLSFGQFDSLIAGDGAFARSVRSFALELLGELGCTVDARLLGSSADDSERVKLRLPWRRRRGVEA